MDSIFIATSSFGTEDQNCRHLLESLGLALYDNPFGRTLSKAEVLALFGQYKPVGIIAGLEPLDADVLRQASEHLKVISRCGAGISNVDCKTAEALGIKVYSTPQAPVQAVAELTVGLMLSLIRNVVKSDRLIRTGGWAKPMGYLLEELAIGLIGLGRIGQRVAILLRSFDCRLTAYDIKPDQAWAMEHRVASASLDELLATCDIVSLHLPYAAALRHFIGKKQLATMRQGSYLVNTSRGGLVDEEALWEALKSGHLRGAALDTFEEEPYKGPLREMENVILSPHAGSYARAARRRMEQEAAENLAAGLRSFRLVGGMPAQEGVLSA
ncbi:MAG: phosphoglycerate dehydrogenase [Elusimicrobia bacterium]|nr:phosphoglycerate dehydrogenase [Elusimicrobiota bacterium]